MKLLHGGGGVCIQMQSDMQRLLFVNNKKMADFNLNDDFDHHSEKSEVEKIDWDTLEEIFVPDSD